MKAKLVGVHTVHRQLASGKTVTYNYAWRGGPRMTAKPGTRAFLLEYARLTAHLAQPAKPDTVGDLVEKYLASADFQKLRASTRQDYERIIAVIRRKFGTMPTRAVEARGSRTVFVGWRDTMKDSPRSADMHMAVLARIFSWSADLEYIARNPLERVRRLHNATRKDIVWTQAQLDTLLSQGRPHLVKAALVALYTMQRQGDVLTMPTIAYEDGKVWIKQAKTGARMRVKADPDTLAIYDEAREARRPRVLVNSYGQPWSSDGFRASWGNEMKRLGITGVTFHDLRGTGITFAYANGVDIEQIAEVSGHSQDQCEGIIRRNYLGNGEVIEAIRRGTKRA